LTLQGIPDNFLSNVSFKADRPSYGKNIYCNFYKYFPNTKGICDSRKFPVGGTGGCPVTRFLSLDGLRRA
jgi:hypothetical protein